MGSPQRRHACKSSRAEPHSRAKCANDLQRSNDSRGGGANIPDVGEAEIPPEFSRGNSFKSKATCLDERPLGTVYGAEIEDLGGGIVLTQRLTNGKHWRRRSTRATTREKHT